MILMEGVCSATTTRLSVMCKFFWLDIERLFKTMTGSMVKLEKKEIVYSAVIRKKLIARDCLF